MSTHIVSMLSMCCRSDALPSPSPLPATHETHETHETRELSNASVASAISAPASVSSSPSCASA